MLAAKSSTLSSLSVLVVTFLKASPAFFPAAAFGVARGRELADQRGSSQPQNAHSSGSRRSP
jgi:hypothetical protein